MKLSGFLFSIAIVLSSIAEAQLQTTIAALRSNAAPSLTTPYFITDAGKEGFFYYDSKDNTSTDNTGTILVSANGKRFKRSFDGAVMGRWFGMIADFNGTAGTNNATPLIAALNSLKRDQTLIIEAGDYYVPGTIIIAETKRIRLQCLGILHFGKRDGIVIRGYEHDVELEGIVGTETPLTGTIDYNSLVGSGVTLDNAFYCNVDVDKISGFVNAIKVTGSNTGGSQYNKVDFSILRENKLGILLTTEPTGNDNWCNENTFTGGRIQGIGGLKSVRGSRQNDPFNGNKFYNVGFEALEYGVDVAFFEANHIIAPRFEAISKKFITLRSDSKNNYITNVLLKESNFDSLGNHNILVGKLQTPSSVAIGDINLPSVGKFVSINGVYSYTAFQEAVNHVVTLVGTVKPERHFATTKVNGIIRNVAYESLYTFANNVTTHSVPENTGWIKVFNDKTTSNTTTLQLSDIDLYDGKTYILHSLTRNPIEILKKSNGASLLKAGIINTPGFWMISYSQGTIYASRISLGANLGTERKTASKMVSLYAVEWDISVVLMNYALGTSQVDLPAAITCRDREITVKNLHAVNKVIINGISSADPNTLDGRGAMTVKSDGYTWNVISSYEKKINF